MCACVYAFAVSHSYLCQHSHLRSNPIWDQTARSFVTTFFDRTNKMSVCHCCCNLEACHVMVRHWTLFNASPFALQTQFAIVGSLLRVRRGMSHFGAFARVRYLRSHSSSEVAFNVSWSLTAKFVYSSMTYPLSRAVAVMIQIITCVLALVAGAQSWWPGGRDISQSRFISWYLWLVWSRPYGRGHSVPRPYGRGTLWSRSYHDILGLALLNCAGDATSLPCHGSLHLGLSVRKNVSESHTHTLTHTTITITIIVTISFLYGSALRTRFS